LTSLPGSVGSSVGIPAPSTTSYAFGWPHDNHELVTYKFAGASVCKAQSQSNQPDWPSNWPNALSSATIYWPGKKFGYLPLLLAFNWSSATDFWKSVNVLFTLVQPVAVPSHTCTLEPDWSAWHWWQSTTGLPASTTITVYEHVAALPE
jgi:hypothetical protein